MPGPAFIGDEVTAAAFRLAGLAVHTPEPGDLPATFDRVLDESSLVLITAGMALRLPPGMLEAAVRSASPPVAVIEGAVGDTAPPDLERAVRSALGVDS